MTGPSFIVFEGIDGSGKTTIAKRVYEYLTSKGKSVLYTFEPTKGVYGDKIRNSETRLPFEEEKDLFFKDRREHVELIKQSMIMGNIVICDRYYPSSVVYQGTMCGNPHSILTENEKEFPYPDMTIIVDCPASVATVRIKSRDGKPDKFEANEVNLEKIRQLYLEIFSKRRDVVVIDGSGSVDETLKQALEHINRLVE